MTRNFCTLFDKNYLFKGLALHSSLVSHARDFHLWVLCMDNLTFDLLQKMDLKNVTLIASTEFENERLLEVKKIRTVAEYSWTCTANLCWHVLGKISEGDIITYLDADMFFFDDPEIIFKEIGNASIAIVEHRLEGQRKIMEKFVGKYNVGWVSFKKDEDGLKSCQWWKDRVLEWCFARFEGGKIGDQHYLNDWQQRFNNVRVIKHEGADVAPWNVANRKIFLKNAKIYIGAVPLVFYHFHNFVLISAGFYLPASAYYIPGAAKKYIYSRYFEQTRQVINMVAKVDPAFNYGYKKKYFKSLLASIILSFKAVDYFYIKYSKYKMEKLYA